MTVATLKSLHKYLTLLESTTEMKRKMPASTNQRSLKEGLAEISTLVGIDPVAFQDPQNIAAVIGRQRFVMIWGQPSVTVHVARIFDSSRILLTVLIESGQLEKATAAQSGSNSGLANQQAAAARTHSNPNQESALESLKPLLAGNSALTCRLFRVLFEHMLGFSSKSSAQQESAILVNELIGSKEHGRSFLATAMFILGAEVDRVNLMSFMLEQGLFGMHIFENLLQNRDYCDAYYTFRRLERAFVTSATDEEKQVRNRIDKFNSQFGGMPCDASIFEADDQDKARVDAHLAAVDLLEAMALTPWSMSLSNSIAAASSNCVRSIKTIARHFERFADGEETKEHANQEIADHLLAFARQFSADIQPA